VRSVQSTFFGSKLRSQSTTSPRVISATFNKRHATLSIPEFEEAPDARFGVFFLPRRFSVKTRPVQL
jgi:hypothetical protein